MDLIGKAVIITGAGRGLGRAYALAAASAGGSVVVNDLEEESTNATVRELTDNGGVSIGVAGSAGDYEFTAGLITRCVDEFGKLDGLINNAGIYYVVTPQDETEARMRRFNEVNVFGSMFDASHAFPRKASHGFGTIVNVTSGAHIGIRGFIDIRCFQRHGRFFDIQSGPGRRAGRHNRDRSLADGRLGQRRERGSRPG